MGRKLKNLIAVLIEAELHEEADEIAQLIKKKAQLNPTGWQDVIDLIDSPYPTQIQERAFKHLSKAASSLGKAAEGLKGLSSEEIFALAQKHQDLASKADFSESALNKYAGNISLTEKAFHFLTLLAVFKNIYYGFQEFKKIQKNASALNINWMDTLQPVKMGHYSHKYANDPNRMLILVELLRNARTFLVETLSALINVIDGVKDIIMLFAAIPSMGLSLIVDFGISILLWLAVEEPLEAAMERHYDSLLSEARSTALDKLLDQKEANLSAWITGPEEERLALANKWLGHLSERPPEA